MMAMRPRKTSSAAVSFCTNVTAAAVTLFAAAALVVLVGDAFLIVDGADKIVEQCSHVKDSPTSVLTWVACHYLSLRPVLLWPLAGEDDGDACFVRTLLLSTAVVSSHYLLTCALLLFGGILKAKHALFVPWVVTHAVVIIFMGGLSAAEIGVSSGEIEVSSVGWFLGAATIVSVLTWLCGLFSWVEVKRLAEVKVKEESRVYTRL